jgi:hypothetical protein
MLFSFRSADAGRYPKILNVQTLALAFDEKGITRLIKEGHATYEEKANTVTFTEFERPRVQVIGSASEWPDVIGKQGFSEHSVIVSERVVADLQRERMTGFTPRGVEITKRSTRKLSVSSAPQYFLLEVSGRISMHVPGWVSTKQVPADLEHQLAAAWDGTDLFIEPPSEVGQWALFCTERVFNLARSAKWTNCGFQPLQYFAPFQKRYLAHESTSSVDGLVERYIAKLK